MQDSPETSKDLDDLVRERRAAIGRRLPAIGGDEVWGLALSGGGIRSATFCFGVLHALASRHLLLRFDLLSTVSGGGYIGATLGRLFGRAKSFADIDRILDALSAGNVAWFCQWLRANGRYLTPRGVADRFFAVAVYARNMVSVHVELGVMGLGIGAVLTLVDLVLWACLYDVLARSPEIENIPLWRDWISWVPSIWLVLPIVVSWGIVVGLAFQAIALVANGGRAKYAVAAACVGTVLLLLMFKGQILAAPYGTGADARKLIWFLGLLFASSWLASLVVAKVFHLRAVSAMNAVAATGVTPIDVQDAARNATTRNLATTFKWAAGVLVVGLIDRTGWWLAYGDVSWKYSGWALAATATMLRFVVPQVAQLQASGRSTSWLLALGNLLGRVCTFALLAWWVAVVHRTVMSPIFTTQGVQFSSAIEPLALLMLACVLYALLTGFDTRFVNSSSLHAFYRARLIRSYLGAANAGRFGRRDDPVGAVDPAPANWMNQGVRQVDDVDPDDDVHICDYRPHAQGGPVHLINVCVNETKDPRGGLFNEDRRGRLATVGPAGLFRLGQERWQQLEHEDGSLTLGSWIAISGAAVAPGMGGRTRGGLPALVMFAGARLGYWWNSRVLMNRVGDRNVTQSDPFGPRMFGKSRALIHETLGDFDVEEGRAWFLSDGGHFENTGAYALLAERAKVIVVIDAGADPGYQFDDLENLVRKARIDLRCDVRFLKPLPANAPVLGAAIQPALGDYGSLNDLVSNQSRACLALARVSYLDDGSEGHLILVKPNLCGGLPVDLFNFKAEQPAFPQQSTADQFFDEAQWESYFQLGTALGDKLRPDNLSAILANSRNWFVDDDGSPVAASNDKEKPAGETAADAPEGRLPSRIAVNAVGATLGLGAISAVAVGAWQGIDAVRTMMTKHTDNERATQKELVELWGKIPAAKEPQRAVAVGALAGALARASENLCTEDRQGWFNRSDLSVHILGQTRLACEELKGVAPPACSYLLSLTSPNAIATRATCLASSMTEPERRLESEGCSDYWGSDYSSRALPGCGHPALSAVQFAKKHELAKNGGYVITSAVYAARMKRDWWHPFTSPATAKDAKDACRGQVIRPMVYGTAWQADIEKSATAWAALGADVMGAVDVTAKALFDGRPQPNLVYANAIQYTEGSSPECAEQIKRSFPKASFEITAERPGRLPRGTVVVWLTADTKEKAVEQFRSAILVAQGAAPNVGPLAIVSAPLADPAAEAKPGQPQVSSVDPGKPEAPSGGLYGDHRAIQQCIERAICASLSAAAAPPSGQSTKRVKRRSSAPPRPVAASSACSGDEVMTCRPAIESSKGHRPIGAEQSETHLPER